MKMIGERVILRSIRPSDFAYIVAWTNNRQVGHFAEDDGYPETLEQCEEWYKKLLSDRYNQVFMIILGDQPIGDVELDHIAWRSGEAELRIRIGVTEFWSQGYGTDAVRTLLHYAFLSMKLQRVYLRVSKNNPRAIRCYQKAGFRKEGKLVRRITGEREEIIYLMRILRNEYQSEISNPDSLQQVG